MASVSIVIPTLNRQTSLRRALASATAQVVPEAIAVEVVVVDNSSDGTARGVTEEFANAGLPVRYVSEPHPGVANARNSGLRAANGAWIAFLDDDEEARPDWIAQLMETAQATGADAVFGPVAACAEQGAEMGALEGYFSRGIERPDGDDITEFAAYLGTNNSMFSRERCFTDVDPFDTSLNETGGEDSLLLRRLVMRGRRFAWAANAGVVEWTPPRRLNWAYVCRRKFLSGQIRVFVQNMSAPGNIWQIALWMAIGATQTVGGAAAAALLYPLDRTRALRASATMYGGLGKVFWARRFRPRLYGSGLVS